MGIIFESPYYVRYGSKAALLVCDVCRVCKSIHNWRKYRCIHTLKKRPELRTCGVSMLRIAMSFVRLEGQKRRVRINGHPRNARPENIQI